MVTIVFMCLDPRLSGVKIQSCLFLGSPEPQVDADCIRGRVRGVDASHLDVVGEVRVKLGSGAMVVGSSQTIDTLLAPPSLSYRTSQGVKEWDTGTIIKAAREGGVVGSNCSSLSGHGELCVSSVILWLDALLELGLLVHVLTVFC